ncbi:hypothetical protein Patl1_35617 [Pistacia atlantica]|nr:hypothetical protein Patl1_35617 [Pistacia atlantica]
MSMSPEIMKRYLRLFTAREMECSIQSFL